MVPILRHGLTPEIIHAAVEARDAHLAEDVNDQLGAVSAAVEAAVDLLPHNKALERLAELEQVLADHARSEGRKPSGSVKQQVEALIDRLHEQDKQTI